MMINTVIVPGESLGGIELGSNVEDIISDLSDDYSLDAGPSSIIINEGMITAYHNNAGIVTFVSCNSTFKGTYLNKLWPGMTVADVLRTTREQVADVGFVKIIGINGLGLSLPNDKDDFCRLTDHFDEDYVFEELWVYRSNTG